MKVLFLGNLPEVLVLIAVFCFILQSPTCLVIEHPQACQGGPCSRSTPAPCPPGTFLSGMGPHTTPFCHLCPSEFFNPWHGQNACLPCGSEATQPEEGKDTCVCQRPGQVFQDTGEPVGCVQRERNDCKDGATWNQEGKCLTREQWNDHCAQEVCPTPGDARGYDPSLGLCLCWGPQSSGMCGPLCSGEQRQILRLSCVQGVPRISVTEGTGSQGFYLLDKPSSPRAVGHPCNLDQEMKSVPLYVIEVNEHGFRGNLTDEHQTYPWSLGTNSTDAGDMSGIQNPIICLQTSDTLAFLVTREHYPEYDLGHFYNTLLQFDWGRFRALAEASRLSEQSPRLFLQQFQLPGVYVFRLNSNRHRKMYLRTLPAGGRCFADGPFALTMPRNLIQTGIAKMPKPVKKPGWPGLLGEMLFLLGLCLLLLIQCQKLSWVRKAAPHPIFRTHQQGYNLDVYISPRTGMTLVRRGQSPRDCGSLRGEESHGGAWEDQVDLEWFDTEAFFEILRRQSLTVTASLSQTNEELKVLYLKLQKEAGSLRQLWGAQRGTSASTHQILTQRRQQEAAEAVAMAAEEESRQRRSLVGEYAASLAHQQELLRQDLCARQDQWASFCSALMEAQWLLKASASSSLEKSPQPGQSPEEVASQLDTLLGHLSQVMLQEGHRLKAWGFLDTGTGAELLQSGPRLLAFPSHLRRGPADSLCFPAASAGPQEDTVDIIVNPVTKLMVPGPNCMMILPTSGHIGPVPPGYFIHPDTGRVLPEAGHLGYDLLSSALIPITDFNAGGVRTSEVAALPYVPYPTNPVTGCPPDTRLPVLQPRRTSQLGALMSDPITGIEVPVLAVTLHPQTREWLTLGGTYCDPLTKMLAPLELGGPMKDPVTGGIVPILGVGLDEHTGQVLAVGGLRDATGSLLMPGDSFAEPLSGKTVRLQGASQQAGQISAHAGGSQALLDANVLVAQRQVIMRLQQCREPEGSRDQGPLESAIKCMRQALTLSLRHILHQARRLERQLVAARDIEASGGLVGLMCCPGTELWVPALYGMEIPDPEGSGLMVPILGVHQDRDSGATTPLAGTMEDAAGKGLVPISIGAQAIDPLTGKSGPVIGVRMDPSAGVAVPVVQVLEALPRGVRDPELLSLLERELRARQQYWQLQEQEEQHLAERLWQLSQELHVHPGCEARMELKAAEEACVALEACCLLETERRARALSTLGSPEGHLLSQADRKEWEEESRVVLGMRKVLHSLRQALEKLRKVSLRLQGQEDEVCLQQSRDQCPHVWNHQRKVVQHLSDGFREMVRDRQNFLGRALGQLQYHRELSRLQLLHIQLKASGTPVCLENYPGERFYGTVTTSLGNQAAVCPLLVPFLKGITARLMEDRVCHLEPEDQRPGADADEVDHTWTPPLLSIMKKIDPWPQDPRETAELQGRIHLRAGPKNSLKNLLKSETAQEELAAVQASKLCAWEFVVYQYGISVMHLLIPQLQAPEITLQIASRVPVMEVSGNVFQGSFFYQGLSAYFKEAFATTLQMSAVPWDNKFDQNLSAILLKEQPISERERDLLSKLIERKPEPCLERESSEEYIKKNKDLLLFNNMENFIKSILSAKQ
ncbi:Predicted gene, 32742 [Apodemus speciosus]|uniref:Predicted gene, 32742 n=1 Tax=Apodemus speciosus TaxID=105296 RepID=A0ABQ0F4K2_APOSI